MLLITCPFCGPRDHVEFSYGGDATLTRPEPGAPDAAWIDYIYVRDNPKGPHLEYWQHHAGCRAWLTARRDTLTHEITATTPARKAAAR